MHSLDEAPLNGRKVLLRLGADVPLTDTSPPQVADITRLETVVPTIHYLLNRHAKVILLAHLGRPKGEDSSLSLRPVYNELARLLGQPIAFAPQLFSEQTKKAVETLESGQVLGLENIRFDPGEDNDSRTFAKKLAEYGDVYVNDAFNVSHRRAASIVAITEFLPSYAGLLLEREHQVLTNLLRHPARPFTVIIGGAKIQDKLPAIKNLLQKADRVLVGGGVANTFLMANGVDVRQSLVDQTLVETAKEIIIQARGRLILPIDYVWSNDQILDVGPQTVELYQTYLKQAKTIFWNGNLGKTEQPEFTNGSRAIAKTMVETDGTTVVGGGDTITIFNLLNLTKKLSFASTGGGATLELLAGATLPGIKALEHK